MTLKISLLHPIVKCTNKIHEICEPFLNANSLSFFKFRRNYGNGKFIILSNNITPFLEAIEANYISNAFFERTNTENYGSVFMGNDVMPPIYLSLLEEKYKIYDIICLLNSEENYCDTISFGLSEKCETAASYYASILKDLQAFANEFLISSRAILEVVEQNVLCMPTKGNEDTFLPPYNTSGYELKGRYGKNYITHEEYIFLHLLHKGKTKSDVVKILSMPPHKVDSLIAQLTEKTGCPLYLLKPEYTGSAFEVDDYVISRIWNEPAFTYKRSWTTHS